MKWWRVVGVALLALTTGCAVSPYRQAEKHIANGEYRAALQVYMKSLNPHVREGKRYFSYEPEAMTGIGVVLWYTKRYDMAVRILQSVVKRSPEYGKALFYLGACYEAQKQVDRAHGAYSLYTGVEPEDPYREPIRWRLDWISRVKYNLDVRRASMDEANMTAASLPKESVAVLYFQNMTQNARLNALSKGLTELINADLAQVEQLKVVPRCRLESVIQNLQLSPQAMADDGRLLQMAKLLGARTLVKGTFRVLQGNNLEIRAGTVYVPESQTPEYVKYSTPVEGLTGVEKQIVRKILADMGVTLTTDQEIRVAETHTRDWKAFMNYGLGLDLMDQGSFKSAQSYFSRSLSLDPLFSMAKLSTVSSELYRVTHTQDVTQMQAGVAMAVGMQTGEGLGPVETEFQLYGVNSASRLRAFGAQMDAGFIPGSETREPYSEAEYGEGMDRTLSGPPALPFVPERWILPGPPSLPQRSQ
jgi:tetratricopeptide (TPR) repeat protein